MANKNSKSKNKTEPFLQFLVLCDAVTNPDQRKKVSFIGVFDKFLKSGIIPHFAISIGWKGGRGTFKFNLRILDPNLKQLFETPEMEMELEHETLAARANINVDGMNLVKPGVYWIEVLLDGKTVQSVPFAVEDE